MYRFFVEFMESRLDTKFQLPVLGLQLIAYMFKLTFKLFHEGNLILIVYYIELY